MSTTTMQQRTMTTAQTTGFVARLVVALRRFICGLHGHDALLHFEQGRISLQCTSCGYESPGWDVKPEPRRTVITARPRLVQIPLVHRRAA